MRVVVITGASSGIGRATALEFAREKDAVVLAARRETALQEAEEQCRSLGGECLEVPTDVTDPEATKELARRTVDRFGRIDVWVNNAAVTIFGRFEEIPLEDFRRVIETNLLGYIYGARAVLPYFRDQQHGVLINVASVVGAVGQPYTSPYVVTKFAIRGLSESLRQELRDTPIQVCTVMPASIDTPLYQQGGNYMGRAPRPMPPVYSPEKVAKTIVRLAENPRREALVGGAGLALYSLHKWMPGLMSRMVAGQVEKSHFQDKAAEPMRGNLYEPMPQQAKVSGGWRDRRKLKRKKAGALLGGVALGLPVAAWLLYRKRDLR